MNFEQAQSLSQSIMMTTILTIAGGFVVSIVIIFFVIRWVRGMTGANLTAGGLPGRATVVRMWDTGMSVNENPVAGLVLEVRADGQEPYQVQTKSLIPRLAVGRIQPGAEVAVRIDPRNRERVALDLSVA